MPGLLHAIIVLHIGVQLRKYRMGEGKISLGLQRKFMKINVMKVNLPFEYVKFLQHRE